MSRTGREGLLGRGLALLLAALFAAVLSACSPRLAGTHDAAVVYAVVADPVSGQTMDAEAAAARVKARLASAHLPADVDATADGRVRVIADADLTDAVDDLVLWRGGLAFRLAADVAAAGARPPVAPPLAQGPALDVERREGGRSLAVTLSDETLAPLVALLGERDPRTPVVVARGALRLGAVPLERAARNPVVLAFGTDLVAYTRAERTAELLRSPWLPPLRRASVAPLPPRTGIAASCAILPFALSFAWLFFVRRFDRSQPEPMWLVGVTFALGGLSVVPAAVVETLLTRLSPWLDPSLATLGGQLRALPIALAVFTLTPGVVEEGAKWLGAWSVAGHRREFDEPVDGIVYGSAAALGFAAVENVKYFALGRMSGAVIAIRAFMTVPAHLFFGALWGYAMGRRLVSRRSHFVAWFALAALAHGAFDASLSIDGTQLVAAALVLVLALAFVAMLQRALRHGAVAPARRTIGRDLPPVTAPLPPSMLDRVLYRVGSPLAFYGSAAGMVVSAFALTVLGAAYEYLRHRVGVVFVTLASGMLAVFGVAAAVASATIPLDVVLDARGITFAGVQTLWRAVTGVDVRRETRRRAFVQVRRAGEPLRLGPVRPDRADEMAQAIAAAAGFAGEPSRSSAPTGASGDAPPASSGLG